MSKCLSCGHSRLPEDLKCPVCGKFYSRIAELIAEEEAEEERSSMRGRFRRIVDAENVKAALKAEFKQVIAGLSKKARFTLFVIFVFVFALVVSVL